MPLSAHSQIWSGYHTSMYGGIHNLSFQPEVHSMMPSDWDINVFSTNMTFFNERFFGYDPVGDIKDGNVHSIEDIFQNHTGVINATIKLPSVAVKLNEKSTFAFSWNIRAILFSNITDLGLSDFLNNLSQDQQAPVSFNNDFARGILTSWSEFGFSYSRLLFHKDKNQLFGGFTFNILSGSGSAYLDLSSLSFSYNDGVISDLNFSFRMQMSEEVDQLINEDKFPFFSKIGYGADFGLTYQRLNEGNNESPYRYKFGFSLTGLGKINYRNASDLSSVNIRADQISRDSFSNIETLTQLKDTLVSVFDLEITDADKVSSRTPLDLHLYGDLNLYGRFYLHAGYRRLISYFGSERFEDLCFDRYYIVPRYESKKIGVYLPITYDKFLTSQVGIAFRWKPLVIGSGNILSYFIKGDNSTNLDIYFATRIMIHRKNK